MLPDAVCRFIHQTTPESLPRPVLLQMRRCLIDTIGAALAGRRTELSRIVHDFAAVCCGGRGGMLWQDGREVSGPGAALANAATVDAIDIHDGHSLTKGHAGAAVVPAAFAMLMRPDVGTLSGLELLTTLAVGYEIALRAGMSLHATAADYHSSGAWNALGCAAATARQLRLDQNQTLHALAVAEYHGPRSPMMKCIDAPTMLKDGSGWGAMTGVSAALLAAAGFTGRPPLLLEADGAHHCWAGLGERWELLKLYFKPHPVCRWSQPAIEGALTLRTRHAIDHSEIAAVSIETFHEATRLSCRTPSTTEEAQYSLPFPVAVALCFGCVGPEHLTGDALRDPRVVRLSQLVELVESDELSRRFPQCRLAHVTIRMRSGETHRLTGAQPAWEADAPPDDVQIVEKFRRLGGHLPAAYRESLERLLRSSHELPDLSVLVSMLAGPASETVDAT